MVPSSAPHEIKDLARREGQKTPDGVLESTPAAKPDHLESLGQPYPAGGVKTFAQKQCVIAQSPGCEEEELDRLDPSCRSRRDAPERHGFAYYRHGTLSLYAALNTATGRVHEKTAARHTSREFVRRAGSAMHSGYDSGPALSVLTL